MHSLFGLCGRAARQDKTCRGHYRALRFKAGSNHQMLFLDFRQIRQLMISTVFECDERFVRTHKLAATAFQNPKYFVAQPAHESAASIFRRRERRKKHQSPIDAFFERAELHIYVVFGRFGGKKKQSSHPLARSAFWTSRKRNV